jgi:hypothetical protein
MKFVDYNLSGQELFEAVRLACTVDNLKVERIIVNPKDEPVASIFKTATLVSMKGTRQGPVYKADIVLDWGGMKCPFIVTDSIEPGYCVVAFSEIEPEVPALSSAIVQSIIQERLYQLKRWGNGFDDTHRQNDWIAFITAYAARGMDPKDCNLKDTFHSPTAFRTAMVKVATLAVAAIEAVDRYELKERTASKSSRDNICDFGD